MGAAHQVPPRHDRRRIRPADAGDHHRHRPRRRTSGESPPWVPEPIPSRCRAAALRHRQPGAQPAPGDAGAGSDRPPVRRRRRDRQPDQRGHPGWRGAQADRPAVRRRAEGVAADHGGATDTMEQDDHPAPPLRDAHLLAGEHQAAEERHRRDGQRRRDGDLRRRFAGVPAAPRRSPGSPAAGRGAGVDPHGRRERSVDQPGVDDRRRPAHRLPRSRSNGWLAAGRR